MNGTPTWYAKRGVAMLIVLLMLVLVVPLCAATARSALTQRLHADQQRRLAAADDLRPEVERLIVRWLTQDADSVVLPPDVVAPSTTVIDDQLTVGDEAIHIHIEAFDQQGMVPMEMIRHASPLRRTVPDVITGVIDGANDETDRIGLDVFVEHDAQWPPSPPIFPLIDSTEPTIGAHVATHASSPARLNINTAPLDRVEAALRMLGRSGIELVEQARTGGEPATLATIRESERNGSRSTEPPIQLVSSSTCWSFRADISVGTVTRSWWFVYQRSSSSWECVQRLEVTH